MALTSSRLRSASLMALRTPSANSAVAGTLDLAGLGQGRDCRRERGRRLAGANGAPPSAPDVAGPLLQSAA